MDTLTCGTPCLLRHMTYSEARKVPITGTSSSRTSLILFVSSLTLACTEIRLEKVLEGLQLTMDEVLAILPLSLLSS